MEFLESLDAIPYDHKDEKNILTKKMKLKKHLGLIFGINDFNYDYHKTNEIIPKQLKVIIKNSMLS